MENEKPNLISISGEDGIDSNMMKSFLKEALELKGENKGEVIVFSADSVIRENVEIKEVDLNIESFIDEDQKIRAAFFEEILKEINKIREDAKTDNKSNNQNKLI